jgi:hypothetical protein
MLARSRPLSPACWYSWEDSIVCQVLQGGRDASERAIIRTGQGARVVDAVRLEGTGALSGPLRWFQNEPSKIAPARGLGSVPTPSARSLARC